MEACMLENKLESSTEEDEKPVLVASLPLTQLLSGSVNSL